MALVWTRQRWQGRPDTRAMKPGSVARRCYLRLASLCFSLRLLDSVIHVGSFGWEVLLNILRGTVGSLFGKSSSFFF